MQLPITTNSITKNEEKSFVEKANAIKKASIELNLINSTIKKVNEYHIRYATVGTKDKRYIECFTRKDGTLNIEIGEFLPTSRKNDDKWRNSYQKDWEEKYHDKHKKIEDDFLSDTLFQNDLRKLMEISNESTYDIEKILLNETFVLIWDCPLLFNRCNELESIINEFDNFDDFEEYGNEDECLIEGLIPMDSIGEFFGETGSYKSFLLLDMLFCISNGIPWHGRKVKQGKVLYVAGEGRSGLERRIKALESKYGMEKSSDFHLSKPYNLMDEDKMQIAGLSIASIGGIQMIVLDTLRRNAPEMNEKEDSHWSKARNNLETFIKPNASVVSWVHHPTKNKDVSSGTQTRENDSDFCFKIIKNPNSKRTTLECKKMKDDAIDLKIEFEMVKTDESLVPKLYHKLSSVNLSDKATKVIEDNSLGERFTEDELRKAVYETFSSETPDYRRQIFNRIKKEKGMVQYLKKA